MFHYSGIKLTNILNILFKTTLVLFLAFSVCLLSADFTFAGVDRESKPDLNDSFNYSIKFSDEIDSNDFDYIFVKYYDENAKHTRYEKIVANSLSNELYFNIDSDNAEIKEVSFLRKNNDINKEIEYFNVYKIHSNGTKELLSEVSNLSLYGFNADIIDKVHNFQIKNVKENVNKNGGDIASRYYSMDYETANSDLGLGNTIANYHVSLKVSPNEDSGSVNHFYFQLVFKSGYSSYVLANNYIPNEQFYPGHTYSFGVGTNEDMGEVIAVNVIPDSNFSGKDQEDSLIIDSIDVIKINDNGINNKYSISSVGEIGFNKANQLLGDSLAMTLPIDYQSECLMLELALTNGRYSTSSQFEGTLLCDIGYKDIYGNDCEISDFDVVHAIYDYQNIKEPKFIDGKYVSNPETMFKGDLTDRFFLFIDNAKSLSYFNFKPVSTNNSSFNLKHLSVSIVNSKYTLHKNNLDEYQNKYENNDGIILLTENLSINSYFDLGTTEVMLKGNEIPEITEDGFNNVVPRIPDSNNDKVNIFVYLDRNSTDPILNNIEMYGEIFYQGRYRSYSNKAKFSTYYTHDGGILLCAYYVNASDFISLSNLIVSSNQKRNSENDFVDTIDYAVIEQTRNGVVVDKYMLQYDHADIMLTGSCSMISAGTSKQDSEYQEVGLSFGKGSSTANLDSMNHDIAVSIKYTSKNDVTGLNTVYSSPYIYLTDQGIRQIKEDETVNLKFREGSIDKVVGLEVIATGGIRANIESGYIATYESDGGKITGWYGISQGGDVSLGGSTFNVSESSDSVKPVTITFITSETPDPVSVSICYKDKNGDIRYKDIPNSSSFENQTETEISVLLPNLDEIKSITIEPESRFYVEEITTSVETVNGTDSKSVRVDKDINSNMPYTVNMSNIVVKLAVSSKDLKMNIENGSIDLTLNEGDKAQIKVNIDGSIDGFGYSYVIEKVIEDESGISAKTIDASNSTKSKGDIEFKVPKTEKNESYRITVNSVENKAINSAVNIYVKE